MNPFESSIIESEFQHRREATGVSSSTLVGAGLNQPTSTEKRAGSCRSGHGENRRGEILEETWRFTEIPDPEIALTRVSGPSSQHFVMVERHRRFRGD